MKAKPLIETKKGYVECLPEEATHIRMNFPGPFWARIIPVIIKGTRKGSPCWTWNGSIEKPDLKPSIRTRTDEVLCHSFVNNGKVQFLSDCTHEFSGMTLDLLDVE